MQTVVIVLAALAALGAACAALFAWRGCKHAKAVLETQTTLVTQTEQVLAYNQQLEAAQASLTQAVQELATAQATQAALEKQQLEAMMVRLQATQQQANDARRETATALEANRATTEAKLGEVRQVVDEKLTVTLNQQAASLRDQLAKFDARFNGFTNQIQGFQTRITKDLGDVRSTVDGQLKNIRDDNAVQLERMRATVDEKLTETLNSRLTASFKTVSDQLETVHKGLGEMQAIASGVGDLKRTLSGVKTRGILGEVQLGAILSDIFTHDQYLENVATKPGSNKRVEFALKIPGGDGSYVLLPIDSKFPSDAYDHVRDAMDAGDAEALAAARKQLEARIKQEAKDIQEKYISVPETTNFALLFLPFEGLYAEVVNIPGLLEGLYRDYKITVAGPSTMAAMLNSLLMSYQTFALQKRADEIQQVLSAVKAEFPKYQKELTKALGQIDTARNTVQGIISTRTNVIERKLKSVEALEDDSQAAAILGMEERSASGEDASEVKVEIEK